MPTLPVSPRKDRLIVTDKDLYCILASSSYIDDRTLVLNHADTFGAFNLLGDIQQIGCDIYGLFHKGSRYVSKFEMRLNDERPLLLSSHLKEKNEILKADSTNADLYDGDVLRVPKGEIHIRREIFVYRGVCYDRIRFSNYGQSAHTFTVSFDVESDFKDIFEVRGSIREAKGTLSSPEFLRDREIVIAYEGLDQIKRRTRFQFSDAFHKVSDNRCEIILSLTPMAQANLEVEILCQDQEGTVTIKPIDLSREEYFHEFEIMSANIAEINSSNEQFNHWIQRSKIDFISLLADTPEGIYPYAGVPWYNTIFGRDGLITAYLSLWAVPRVAKDVLLNLARLQAADDDAFRDSEPGKIVHEIREGEMANTGEIPFKQYYGTIDATPLFVFLAGEYFRRTADLATIDFIWPSVRRALDWIDHYGDLDGDGFVEYQRKHEAGLFNQGWKDSHDSIFYKSGEIAEPPIALCEVQAYVYAAKINAAKLAEVMNEFELARQLISESSTLRESFNKSFWDTSLGTFAIALDKHKRPCSVSSSNAGQCLFSGIVPPDYVDILKANLLSPEMFNGWGIRTLASNAVRYNPMSYHNGSIWPHDNALIAMGFSRYGRTDIAAKIFEAMFNAALKFEGQRLPELFCGFDRHENENPTKYPVACSPQAWAVTAVYGFIQSILGMRINAEERQITFTRPILPGFLTHLTLDRIQLGWGQTVGFTVCKHQNDFAVNVLSKPSDWRVVVVK
jgi:glycogen debranching enzyme